MSNKRKDEAHYLSTVLALADIVQVDYQPERDLARAQGRYGKRVCADACVKVRSAIVQHKRAWRRVYTDGRLYIHVKGKPVYLDAEASAHVLDVISRCGA